MNAYLNGYLLRTLVITETKLRLRRLSSLVTLFLIMAVSWAMIIDPATGNAMMVIGKARVAYNSTAISLVSATNAALLFMLAGFYLVRGRIAEDLRYGTGSVIAATNVSNGMFLFARWLGGVTYLLSLLLAYTATMLACHMLRGDGAIELWVYAQFYIFQLLPAVLLTVSLAICSDSFSFLMGKAGDVIFFIIWMASIAVMVEITQFNRNEVSALMLFDFSGLATTMQQLMQTLQTRHINIGSSPFDAQLPVIVLSSSFWTREMISMRLGTAVLALLPLIPAALFFHRFSPDRVKASSANKRRTPLEVLNHLLRPLAHLVQPMFRLAAVLPGFAGQVMADVALSLLASPSAILALGVVMIAALLGDMQSLQGWAIFAVAFWGVLISDISTRDFQADVHEMSAAVVGGRNRRYLRQFAASIVLGLLFMGVIGLRWLQNDTVQGLALFGGVISLSGFAVFMGSCSRTSRTFLASFLFGLYLALNIRKVPYFDAFGFNHVANLDSIMKYLLAGAVASLLGYFYNSRREI